MRSRYYSTYLMRDGDPSVFGDFNCTVLGERLVVTIDRLEDDDARCLDILGVPIQRRDLCIHISGKDEYGEQSHGEWVREIGWQSARRVDGQQVQSTMRDAEAVVIATHFMNPRGSALHMAQFANAAYYVTAHGLAVAFAGKEFTPRDVAAQIDVAKERQTSFPYADDKQHVGAIRRLCEAMVGSRHGLERVKRWTYAWEGAALRARGNARGR